jgi:hypothetical protein
MSNTTKNNSDQEEISELATILQLLPSEDELYNGINDGQLRYILPRLDQLHKVVHEILPKPNKGLWEPELKLDPFLLSYIALMYKNYDRKKGKLRSKM